MGLNLAPVAALEGWGEPGGVRLSARVEESPATSSGIPPPTAPAHFPPSFEVQCTLIALAIGELSMDVRGVNGRAHWQMRQTIMKRRTYM